jgi:uncharacterized GH25 family protein
MRRLSFIVILSCVAASAAAHDFWVQPSTYRPGPEPVVLRLMVGDNFSGEPVARNDRRIEHFIRRDTAGTATVPGVHGSDPAGAIEVQNAAVIGYRSTPIRHRDMSPSKFESYLREEGLERIIDRRQAAGKSKSDGREIYSRSAKTLIGQDGQLFRAPLGFRFEIVPESNPAASNEAVRLRLLYENKPVEGAMVTLLGPQRMTQRSDAEGRITFENVPAGVWMAKAVHMTDAPAASGADWESIWASMTFQRGPR